MNIIIRPVLATDADACGRIIYTAFKNVSERHAFSPPFDKVESAIQFATFLIAHPRIFGIVAEKDAQIIGSNFLDERDLIRGLGPITVDEAFQGYGVGRKLMEYVLEHGRNAVGIRLLQDSFNPVSLALYASLGLEVKESTIVMIGKPKGIINSGCEVRPLRNSDLDECATLCKKVHGYERTNELQDALKNFDPFVIVREGHVTGYVTAATFWQANHGVAKTEEDLKSLLSGAAMLSQAPLSLLLPTRQANLFRWCLNNGLRAVRPMTLMAIGKYQEPKGYYFPSVFY